MNYIVKNCFLQLAAQVLTIGGGTGGRIGLGPPLLFLGVLTSQRLNFEFCLNTFK